MTSLTQNNKIAVAAVSIFVVSFSSMLLLLGGESTSPDYLKSDVLEAAISHGGASEGHGVYFSDSGEGHGEDGTNEGDTHETPDEHAMSDADMENMYRALTGKFDCPLFALWPEGKTKFLSHDFVENYGYELNEMEEEVFFSYIYPTDLPDFVTEYTSVIQSGKAVDGVGPYRFTNKDGSLSVHLVSFLPVVTEQGKVVEVIGSVKDITAMVEDFGASMEEEESGDEVTEADSHIDTSDFTVEETHDLLRRLLSKE